MEQRYTVTKDELLNPYKAATPDGYFTYIKKGSDMNASLIHNQTGPAVVKGYEKKYYLLGKLMTEEQWRVSVEVFNTLDGIFFND